VISVLLSQLWVQRLGWTLLHFLWQGTAIAVAYAMLRSLLGRSLSAQGRYVLACAALLAMTVAPPLTFPADPEWGREGLRGRSRRPNGNGCCLPSWRCGCWACLLFRFACWAAWRFTARLQSTAHPAPAEWQADSGTNRRASWGKAAACACWFRRWWMSPR
jgi:hypothetical protein